MMTTPAYKPGPLRSDPPAVAQQVAPQSEQSAQSKVSTGWRIVLFLWVTAFGFLVVYEVIWTIFRLLHVK
jgi:hypothetical protein